MILATDQPDDQGRFEGKTVHRATPGEAIRHTARLLREAAGDRDLPPVAELASSGTVPPEPQAGRSAPPPAASPEPAPQPVKRKRPKAPNPLSVKKPKAAKAPPPPRAPEPHTETTAQQSSRRRKKRGRGGTAPGAD